ncbi:MAG: 16S rRNA (guanine(527)-N(7))-methyltransferase RsmG [Abditibacteriota bacterium]|nr:16S rRNA (guanine(527)-N(7))-methyltransferase RsmG [Abditibacteriota bacterium]
MIDTALLTAGAAALGLAPGEKETEQFAALADRLTEANKQFNLTAITDPDRIVTEHFLDSLTALKAGSPRGKDALDLGTGAGFPGLPLAICCPEARLTLMDATAKKLRYIDDTAAALGLGNVTTLCGRAEELGRQKEYRERFDVVYARAVADMTVLCELALPFVKPGGLFVAQKSADCKSELSGAREHIGRLGGTVESVPVFNIPMTAISRSLIVIRKTGPTPGAYPRDYARIKKHPGR